MFEYDLNSRCNARFCVSLLHEVDICLKVFNKIASSRESMLPVAFMARSCCSPYYWQRGDAVWRLPASFTGQSHFLKLWGVNFSHFFWNSNLSVNFKLNFNSTHIYIFWANILFFRKCLVALYLSYSLRLDLILDTWYLILDTGYLIF